ncbi:RusA family crossover junction endodeoxyribonuclease [Sutterella sp.]|uniref:RusA family crossover junction endodeoxyribonuclease n=1 Tax=Sutterella sp. TaxID=1981025 RepID=UPI0026E0AF04|nr:RusA family crossover junction endodeoxyribonuclease [Sutterella sp.]MDO5531411.1 RusA family crossover junction endodeoxyribonuclease [Sutterella sp.]
MRFIIPGTPVPKGRPIFSRFNHIARTPEKTKRFEEQVRLAARVAGQHYGDLPCVAIVTSVFEPPASWSKKQRTLAMDGIRPHVSRPDADNLTKAVLDGMNGEVINDDARLVGVVCMKRYGPVAQTIVEILPLPDGMATADLVIEMLGGKHDG